LGNIICKKILVVCVGNICRSPVGAEILRRRLPRQNIHSAGLCALVGHSVHPSALQVASQYGIVIEHHYAQQVTRALCHQADLILVMETSHIPLLVNIAIEARGKIMLFGGWHKNKNIPDPIGYDEPMFNTMFHHLLEAADGWVRFFDK